MSSDSIHHVPGYPLAVQLLAHVLGWPLWAVGLEATGWTVLTVLGPTLLGVAGLWSARNAGEANRLRRAELDLALARYRREEAAHDHDPGK